MSGIITALEYLFAFVLMLGVLITVHEFGHFIVAKLCDVRVLRFSIGFGPALGFGRYRLNWIWGETEYRIAWFPLGGYVMMLGEQPGDENTPLARANFERTLVAKPLWKKLAIVLAGPAMNLILPVFIMMGFLWIGIERDDTVIGSVAPASPAAAAGLEIGDRILALDDEPLGRWIEFEMAISERGGETLRLEIERAGQRSLREVVAARRSGLDFFNIPGTVGWIGVQHEREQARLALLTRTGPAARAGLRSGDLVLAVDDVAVADWPAFVRALAGAKAVAQLVVERPQGDGAAPTQHRLSLPTGQRDPAALGIAPARVLIREVGAGSPAARAGIAPGDLIVAIDAQPLGSFRSFQEIVRGSDGRPLAFDVLRDGEVRSVSLSAEKREIELDGVKDGHYLIGVSAVNNALPGATRSEQVRNPLRALPRAVVHITELTLLMLDGVGRIVSGEISRRHVGGPIEIARQSGRALEAGWGRFLRMLILISINLAILNLLPVPVLDGGQAMMFLIERVRGRPLSLRSRLIATQLGLVLILLLMGLAFWNDISRYWGDFVGWLGF